MAHEDTKIYQRKDPSNLRQEYEGSDRPKIESFRGLGQIENDGQISGLCFFIGFRNVFEGIGSMRENS